MYPAGFFGAFAKSINVKKLNGSFKGAGCDTLTSSPMFTRIPPIFFSHSNHLIAAYQNRGILKAIPLLETGAAGNITTPGNARARHGKCLPGSLGMRTQPAGPSTIEEKPEKKVFPFVAFPCLLNFYHYNSNHMNLSCGWLFPS
jgi:hypothetical protein